MKQYKQILNTLLLSLLTSLCFGFTSIAQNDNPLSFFEPLMGRSWTAEGNWGDGSKFRQTVRFEYSLNGTLVLARADGFINDDHTLYGPRNHGIRMVDPATGSVVFSEYDVFGGVTKGDVIQEGKNIRYVYKYGGTIITDLWEYVDDNTYKFTVGDFDNGTWKQVYLTTQFTAAPWSDAQKAYLMMKSKITGIWSSPAWDGKLNEVWTEDHNGNLTQTAEYVEDGKITYRAHNKIEITAGELILSTVIEGSNPKIFKATGFSANEIVFENSEYSYPNKVTYTFLTDGNFDRKIQGSPESGQADYTFNFKPKQ